MPIPLGILASQALAGALYRLQTFASSDFTVGASAGVDSAGNLYLNGRTGDSPTAAAYLTKFDNKASVVWQRDLVGLGTDNFAYVKVDSAGNSYSVGSSFTTANSTQILITKHDTSGSVLWQRLFGGVNTEAAVGIALDSSSNAYIVGRTNSTGAGGFDVLLAKYDSGGSIQWQRRIGGASGEQGTTIAVSLLGDVYIAGYTASAGSGDDDFLIAKYDSSGTIQWQRVLGGGSQDRCFGVATDSAGDVYVVGHTASTGAGGNDVLLAKYNSSGTIQWQRILGGASTDQAFGIVIDTNDNLYIVGFTTSTGAGSFDYLIAKYDTSGNVVWQRALGSTSFDVARGVTVDSNNNLYVIGDTGAYAKPSYLAAVLPNDGSLTGTYSLNSVNFVYAASSLTAATPTLTAATSSLSTGTTTLGEAAGTLTAGTPTYADFKVNL